MTLGPPTIPPAATRERGAMRRPKRAAPPGRRVRAGPDRGRQRSRVHRNWGPLGPPSDSRNAESNPGSSRPAAPDREKENRNNRVGENQRRALQERSSLPDRKKPFPSPLGTVRNRTSICNTMRTLSNGLRCFTSWTRRIRTGAGEMLQRSIGAVATCIRVGRPGFGRSVSRKPAWAGLSPSRAGYLGIRPDCLRSGQTIE
jgi:hypothetical protein